MQEFQLLLKNGKVKSYHRITVFIILINLAVFTLFALLGNDKKIKITGIIFSILLLVSLVIRLFSSSAIKGKTDIVNSISLYAIAFGWFAMGFWWAGILSVILAFLYYVARSPLLIYFNRETINYAAFPPRRIKWIELNNTILKDGILTVDFKNNKIIQAEIDEEYAAVNEKEFNEFCKQQLSVKKQLHP